MKTFQTSQKVRVHCLVGMEGTAWEWGWVPGIYLGVTGDIQRPHRIHLLQATLFPKATQSVTCFGDSTVLSEEEYAGIVMAT